MDYGERNEIECMIESVRDRLEEHVSDLQKQINDLQGEIQELYGILKGKQ